MRDTIRTTDIAISVWGVHGGSLATVAADLAKGFVESGCRVDILSANDRPPGKDLGFPAEVRFAHLHRRSLTSFLPLARYLRRNQPAALITVGPVQNAPGIVAKCLSRYRGLLLLTVHGTLSYMTEVEHADDAILSRTVWFARHFYRFADAIVAISEAVRADTASLGLRGDAPLLTIPDPVDLEAIRRRAREPFVLPAALRPHEPLLVSVGTLRPRKNHRLLIDAFALFRARKSLGKLLVVGDGPSRADLIAYTGHLGLSEHVVFAGFVENQHSAIASADLMVHTADEEGFGLVLAEAMAIGVPIVAVDGRGAVSETLGAGSAGLLVAPNDPEALCAAIVRMLEDVDLRNASISAGLEQVKRFQPRLVAQEWLSLIEDLGRVQRRAAEGRK